MRDDQVLALTQDVDRKISNNSKVLHNTITLNRTRLDAIEKVLFGGRIRFFMVLIGMIVNPKWVQDMVQAFHEEQIAEYNEAARMVKERSEKENKLIKVKKPEPIILRKA